MLLEVLGLDDATHVDALRADKEVMSAYNKTNGVYASENRWLLTDLLRGEWDYDGVVVSDWGAVHDPVEAVGAGTDLRMPGRPEDDRLRVAEAAGRLAHPALARVAQRLALLAERTTPDTHHAPVVDLDQHHQLTRRAAAGSAVLLVNDGTLPLNLQKPSAWPSSASWPAHPDTKEPAALRSTQREWSAGWRP